MTNDPIVEEIHRTRERLLARYGGDLRALIRDMQQRTEQAARAGRAMHRPAPTQPPVEAQPPAEASDQVKKAG